MILSALCVNTEQLILKNLGKTFAPEGRVEELEHSFGLDAESVVNVVKEALSRGQ